MHCDAAHAEQILSTAVKAVLHGASSMAETLNALPTAIYTTDAEGNVTFFNTACLAFAGRTPVVGEDRWCVTWKLYTKDGRFLPHEDCPMAVAIREKRPVRGVEAIAERPDGTRRRFRPFPTPLLDDHGDIVGAVNMLLEIGSSTDQAAHLRMQAERCRRLAKSIGDRQTMHTLQRMASDYDSKAQELQRAN